jgi:3-oxoacyl-[acyl-carrier-protein] synthase II
MEDVLVTGIGVISSVGSNIRDFWKSLTSGINGYHSSHKSLPEDYPFRKVGMVQDFSWKSHLDTEEISRTDRAAQFGVSAAAQAILDAKLADTRIIEIPVVMGTTCGANYTLEESGFDRFWFGNSIDQIKTKDLEKYRHCDLANAISKKFDLIGPSYVLGTSCSAGNHAIGEAYDMLQSGRYQIAICGGSEALSLLPLYGFHSIKSLADEECRPFNNPPSGLILGEGAGVLVLESAKSALARKAKIYAKIKNWHLNCDAKIFSSPIIDGSRCKELIMQCLANAGLNPENIDYINLHGTGSGKNDLMEANGIQQVFGSCDPKPMASSIKSMIGHTLGAAGAFDNIATVLSIAKGEIPPITNSANFDQDYKLNFITERNYKKEVGKALSLTFAFGGCNIAIVFEKYDSPQ